MLLLGGVGRGGGFSSSLQMNKSEQVSSVGHQMLVARVGGPTDSLPIPWTACDNITFQQLHWRAAKKCKVTLNPLLSISALVSASFNVNAASEWVTYVELQHRILNCQPSWDAAWACVFRHPEHQSERAFFAEMEACAQLPVKPKTIYQLEQRTLDVENGRPEVNS